MIQIETDRLIIRDPAKGDLIDLHELISDEKTMYYMEDIRTTTLKESKNNLKYALKEASAPERRAFYFSILNKESGAYIGQIGVEKMLESPEGHIYNLGYFVKPSYWNKGYVTEAAKAVVRYTFENLNAIKIETGCIAENKGSEKVMIKLGMIKEAHFKAHALVKGCLKDRVEYGIMYKEWVYSNKLRK